MPEDPESASIGITSSEVGATLRSILEAGDIRPGDQPSYQLCKAIYIAHPLGAKMAEAPIRLAQSVSRELSVPGAPEDVIKEFRDQWKSLGADQQILNLMTHARIYGISSIGFIQKDMSEEPIDLKNLWQIPDSEIAFNIFDPLNSSGLIVDQDPNSPTFQKQRGDMTVAGRQYHRSRTITMMNEQSIYIAWTDSAFSYAGRSVYQRALYPLKSFIWTMIADEMVARKAGLIVAKMEQPGSIVDQMTKFMQGVRRNLLKQAKTDNVLSIGIREDVQTLNLRNVNDAMTGSRDNIIKNVATAADMPAKLLTQEAFVLGFGEGTEDAKAIAAYIDRIRTEMGPAYEWFDLLTMYRAWTPEFFDTIKKRYPEQYGKKDFQTAFYEWKNAFSATWPSFIQEAPSEKAGVDDIRAQRVLNAVQVFAPFLDDENQAHLLDWAADQLNQMENLFQGITFKFDPEAFLKHLADQHDSEGAAAENEREQQLAQEEDSLRPPKPTIGVDSTRVAQLAGIIGQRRPRRQIGVR